MDGRVWIDFVRVMDMSEICTRKDGHILLLTWKEGRVKLDLGKVEEDEICRWKEGRKDREDSRASK
jgi:hypothetical protein